MHKPKVSLIIPAYREEAMIDSTLTEVSFWLDEQNLRDQFEVVVVAVQAGDATGEIAKAQAKNFKHFKVVEPTKPGKGRNVAEGMQVATGDYKIFTDADLATPLSHIPDMLERLQGEDDICIGVRNINLMHDTLLRRWSSRLSNMLIQALVAPGISDTQCGFKGFKADAAERIFSQLRIFGWGFDFEVLAMARVFKYRISTIKINDWADPKGEHGLSGESQTVVMLKTLKELFKVRINLIKGVYR